MNYVLSLGMMCLMAASPVFAAKLWVYNFTANYWSINTKLHGLDQPSVLDVPATVPVTIDVTPRSMLEFTSSVFTDYGLYGLRDIVGFSGGAEKFRYSNIPNNIAAHYHLYLFDSESILMGGGEIRKSPSALFSINDYNNMLGTNSTYTTVNMDPLKKNPVLVIRGEDIFKELSRHNEKSKNTKKTIVDLLNEKGFKNLKAVDVTGK